MYRGPSITRGPHRICQVVKAAKTVAVVPAGTLLQCELEPSSSQMRHAKCSGRRQIRLKDNPQRCCSAASIVTLKIRATLEVRNLPSDMRLFQKSPRQTKPKKGQFMNFSQGHSGTKVQCESCLFSQGKTPEFTKMGEIHELFILPLSLVWFPGATPDDYDT